MENLSTVCRPPSTEDLLHEAVFPGPAFVDRPERRFLQLGDLAFDSFSGGTAPSQAAFAAVFMTGEAWLTTLSAAN